MTMEPPIPSPPCTRLVLVHLEPPRDPLTSRVRKSLDISFSVMSSNAFRCPTHSPGMVDRVGTLFEPREVRVISEEQDAGEGCEGDEYYGGDASDQERQHDENAATQRTVEEYIEQYMEQIQQAYRRCFAKAAYTYLRSYGTIAPQDLVRCLDVMRESHVDLDLSEFMHVLAAPKAHVAYPYATLHEQFAAKVARSFARVPLPGTPYFYYHSSSRTREGTPTGNGAYAQEEYDEDEWGADGYEVGEDMEYDPPIPDGSYSTSSLELCPVFIGETDGDIDSKESLGMYSLPLLMRMEVVREGRKGNVITDVVVTLPTPDVSPVQPITLRFVCLVLPPLLGPARLLQESICHVMHVHKKRIAALLSSEILSSLLTIRPLTESMLRIVERHLTALPTSPSTQRHIHHATFDLHFVDRREGNRLFPQELQTSKPSPSTTPDNPALVRLRGDLYTLATHPQTYPPPNDGPVHTDEPIEYWLLLTCQMDLVTATLFSPLLSGCKVEEEEEKEAYIWKRVRAGIAAVARRVNQLILLYHLHDSRTCTDLLLAAESPTPHTPSRTPRDDRGEGKGKGATTFRPGEFECPLVHTITLPLHDRVQPTVAVRSLILSALHPFAIANRKTLFVYHEKNERIFYICLHASVSTQSSPSTSALALDPPSQISPPPSPSPNMPSLSFTPSQAFITLNVYGVDPAGPEITQHLHQLLENKLSSVTLSTVSTLFLRNPLLKLTTQDLDFLRPPASLDFQNPQSVVIDTPTFVDEPYFFLLLLKYNLMQFLQPIHLSQVAQQREDADNAQQREDADTASSTPDRLEIRQSEFMLMYNHIPSPTSTHPFTAIGQGMACIALSLLDAHGARMVTIPRSSTRSNYAWSLEDLQAELVDASSSSLPRGPRVLLRVWNRGSINVSVLVDYLVLCANQTICEYALESLLSPSNTVTLDTLPAFVRTTEQVLAYARSISTPSTFEHTISLSIPTWAAHSVLTDLRDAMADTGIARPYVYSCREDASGIMRCSMYPSTGAPGADADTSGCGNGIGSGRCSDCDDDCTYATASASDFYNYDDENADVDYSSGDTYFATSMMTLRTQKHGFFFILGGKKVEPAAPSTKQPQQEGAFFYPHIKDSQFPEPILRHCVAIARLDMPQSNEQVCKLTFRAYNCDQSKLDLFTSLCSRLVSLHALRQHLVGTALHHKLGLFQHQPPLPSSISVSGITTNGQTLSRLTWDNVEAIVAPMPLVRRRTISSGNSEGERHKEEKESDNEKPQDQDTKKPRPEVPLCRPPRPTLEFDTVFRDNYPPSTPTSTSGGPYINDPVLQHTSQARALAIHIEQKAASRMAAVGSISILPTPTSSTPASPPTPSQLDAVIAIARLVHFRCIPFLFGDQHMAFGPTTQPTLPMIDAFVRDYIEYLSGFGVVPLLVEGTVSSPLTTPTKRISTRAYLQKVFLDGTLLVKISFRSSSVACELFAVPQLNPPHHPPTAHSQFSHTHHPPIATPHFGEEMTRFTRDLHLNSFTYDFHVNQLYRMIKFPYAPSSPTLPSATTPTQSVASILQALHQYYPTPPLHASTRLDSVSMMCPISRLSAEGPAITTDQILEFMMLEENCTSTPFSPLPHIGISPALLLCVPPPPPYSDLCAVVCSKQAIATEQTECGGKEDGKAPVEEESPPQLKSNYQGQTQSLSLHIFVVKVGEICLTDHSHTSPSSNAHLVSTLRKAVATSGIHYQRNQLWTKLLRANPYAPALTYDEFHVLMRLVHTRPVTQLDPTLTHPVNLMRIGPGVWNQLHAQLRQVSIERSRQVFMDPVRHLLIFHPTNNALLVHFVWDEGENEASIALCRLDERSVGDEVCDKDEMDHLSHLVNIVCHYLWRHIILKPH